MSKKQSSGVPKLWHKKPNVHFVPIRHHSPACARHLLRLIDDVGPAEILIEGPQDYQELIGLIGDEVTEPPVAIVSVPKVKGSKAERAVTSYFPLCDHSPELIALRQAASRKIPSCFIDLPSSDRMMMLDDLTDNESETVSLTDERAFDSSDYVRAVAMRLGCRDQNEVWDHLFETRLMETEFRGFFDDVGAYCHHVRLATSQQAMEQDGTLAREAHMARCIKDRMAAAGGPVIVVTGGFHTPALIDLVLGKSSPKPARSKAPATQAYLVRYGFQQLDMLNGYGAGLPLPGYYDRLWRAASDAIDSDDPWRAVALDVLGDFAEHLRQSGAWSAPSVPLLSAAMEAAVQLARLRQRRGPAREDLLDACRSTFLKGEETGDVSSILVELHAFLTGSKIGNVPPSAGSPPIVEAARADARRHRLNLEDGDRRNRELDIYRKPAHRRASRFLHAMTLLETGFAQRTGGPDLLSGVKLDALFESWSYAWSPMVEARLIELAATADTVTEACAVELAKRVRALEDEGRGRSAGAVVDLFLIACQAGVHDPRLRFLPLIEATVLEDADLGSIVVALRKINLIWNNRTLMELPNGDDVEHVIGVAYRRALYLMNELASVNEERLSGTLEALADLREVVITCEAATVDTGLFDEAVRRVLDQQLHPALNGAVAALGYLAGILDKSDFVGRMRGSLGGAYVDPADKVAFLRGVMTVSRELIRRVPGLVEEIDLIIGALDGDDFIALLPHLRLAFTALDPRDTDNLARVIADRHDVSVQAVSSPVSYDISAEEVQRNLGLSAQLSEQLTANGLAGLVAQNPGGTGE